MDPTIQAFTVGILTAASPCLLPLYPGFIAYLTGNSRTILGRRVAGLLGLAVLAGVLTTAIATGFLLAAAAIPAGSLLTALVPAADVVLIVLGGLLLIGHNPFERLPGLRGP